MSFYHSAFATSNVIGAWDTYLMWRQRKSYNRKDVPPAFREVISDEEYAKSQEYGRERSTFNVLDHIKDLVISNVGLLCKIPAKLYYFVAAKTGLQVGSFLHCYAFSLAGDVISTMLNVPSSYYGNFVIEERHGFNKMTRWEFVKDELKSFALRALLLHPIQVGLIQFIVEKFGERFPFYFFLASSAVVFAFMFLFPTFIQPLFNTFSPLDEAGELYGKIQKLASLVGFPLKKVYVVDGSRRSSHSNAYMYGFWNNKRIVLYDTLLNQMNGDDEQVLAVLCHELGHWKHGHTIMLLGMSLGQLMAISYGAKAVIFNPDMYRQFGFREVSPFVGFDIFAQVFLEPLMTLIGYAFSYLSRQLEFQADRFAVSKGYGQAMQRSLRVMAKENKSSLTPDPLYSALTYSHPPMVERLHAIEMEEKKQK